MSEKYTAIVLSAGSGSRMKSSVPKQYMDLLGKPVLYYSLVAFQTSDVDEIILVTGAKDIEYCRKQIVDKYSLTKVKHIVPGGDERYKSVYEGLKAAKGADYILIHDGARPFINEKIIEEGIKYANIYGAAAPGVTPKDTIKIKNEDNISVDTPDRNTLVAVQTPQCFKYDEIYQCHRKIKEENAIVTDDTSVVERYGHKVYLYEGDYTNIKVTTPEDLILAERLI